MKRIFLFVFSVIYLTLSCAIFYQVPARGHMDVDSPAYESVARGEESEMPTHTNGYAWFLRAIYSVFGHSRAMVVFLQVLLGLCCGFLIFALAQRLFGEAVALLSFAFFSANLGFLVFPQFILSELLLAFFLLWASERFLKGAFVASGLLFGVSIMVKPVALYFIVFLLLILAIRTRSIKTLALFTLCFYLPVVGYMASNRIAYGRFCVSKLEQANLFIWFHSKIKATQRGTTHHEEMGRLTTSSDELKRQFFALIVREPLLAIRVWMREVAKTFFGLYTSSLKVLLNPSTMGGGVSFFSSDGLCAYIRGGATSPWVVAIGWFELVWNLLRYLLVLLGAWFMREKKHRFFLLFAIAYIFYFSMITGHDGCGRYRLMFEFLLIIMSSYAIKKHHLFISTER